MDLVEVAFAFFRFSAAGINDLCRNADCGCTLGNGIENHRTGGDFGVVADRERTENLGTGADHHARTDGRMAFAYIFARSAERYTLIDGTVVADLGGFADNNAHAVVDEQAAADFGTRMNLNTREKAAELGDKAR